MALICDYCERRADMPSDVPWRVGVQAQDGQGAPLPGVLLHERDFCSEEHLRAYFSESGAVTEITRLRKGLRQLIRDLTPHDPSCPLMETGGQSDCTCQSGMARRYAQTLLDTGLAYPAPTPDGAPIQKLEAHALRREAR